MQTVSEKKGRLHKAYYRNGEHHRAGADVSFGDIVKFFGFRAINIGRWVTKEEQQIAANLFFDALCDLMQILNVPEQVISLRGRLSLGFGVGGRKHSCAHYDASKHQLSLAKNAGGGSLAHEWFHAFDHYICDKVFENCKPYMFASETWLNENHQFIDHPLNLMLSKAFGAVFLDAKSGSASALMQNSIHADSQYKIFYYARPQEVAARAFERVVQEHQIKNTFLVAGTKQSNEASIGLYPSGTDLQNIAHFISEYFLHLARSRCLSN